ncbi:MAG: hypothetical protein AB1749_08805 [Pseudomonadota bacterium]
MLSRIRQVFAAGFDQLQSSQRRAFAAMGRNFERQLLLSGQIAARQVRQMERIDTLADVEFRVSSQWGEDGIIEWLCHKLPGIPRSFVEFGVENFTEANTRFLLQSRGWRGLVIDGSSDHMAHLRNEQLYWMHDLVAVSAFVTAENIDALIRDNGFAGELGILSVDIDGNDYWVLKAIQSVRPAILICEINGVLGDRHAITVPYDPAFERLKAHHSGQYFGASLAAIMRLAAEKSYTFVGTNSNGVNAFFVRNDLSGPVLESIARIKSWPARHRDSRSAEGTLTFTRGTAKAELIRKLPVVDVATGRTHAIEELMPLYSPEWEREI